MSDDELREFMGDARLPLAIELERNVILAGLQGLIDTEILPESLAYDVKGFDWRDMGAGIDVTFSDAVGMIHAVVYVDLVVSKTLSIVVEVNAEVRGYVTTWTYPPKPNPQDPEAVAAEEAARLRNLFPHLHKASEGNDLARAELAKLRDHLDLLQRQNTDYRLKRQP